MPVELTERGTTASGYLADPRYLGAITAAGGGPFAHLCHGGLSAPLERVAVGGTDATVLRSPIGFSGLPAAPPTDEIVAACHRTEPSAVALYMLSTPGVDHDGTTPPSDDFVTNYVVDLRDGVEAVVARMRRDSRSRSRKLLNTIHRHDVATSTEHDKRFADRYRTTAERLDFPTLYQFDLADFQQMTSDTKAQLLHLCDAEGTWIGGAVIGFRSTPDADGSLLDVADYLYSAVESSVPNASRSLLVHLMHHLGLSGVSHLCLGGGISEADGLADFKASMGSTPVRCARTKIVIDPDRYAALESNRPAARTGHFPSFSLHD